ncbi:uncharacterized protein [Coffea arabica]|uniref:Uncharacterized protein n=1 Tax=Coffea arabica TaxID=13443 RepID=A0A6P6UWT6_COFAR|nr:uncharacterized protein LOC113715028 [Coffea arabica]
MKSREGKGPPSTDLLVCFPSRAHLTLMPKPICSPARPSEPSKRQHNHHQHQHHHPHSHHHHNHRHHLIKKSSTRNGVAGQASPILWAKNKPMSKEIDEPTSPKVTCAGQIKVKPKASSCKNWQSVMEEIERLHNKSKHKKRPGWAEALGFKKDVMQFLTCLRSIRFDFRCFGAFPSTSITSDDEDDVDEDDDECHQDHHQNNHLGKDASDDHDSESSRTVFSKWFMVLQENNSTNKTELVKTDNKLIKEEATEAPCAPPPNALLLMRCRSAPAKTRLEEKEEDNDDKEEERHDDDDDHDHEKQTKEQEDGKRAEVLAIEEEKKRKDNLVVMRCGTADFYKFSSDIAKETWVVGGIKDSLSRSRSWKR